MPGKKSLLPMRLTPCRLINGAKQENEPAPIPDAIWYTGSEPGDGTEYRFPAGSLADAAYLTADFLVDGDTQAIFIIKLHESDSGGIFTLVFSELTQCQARIRMPMEATRQNRWGYPREAAWLKPICGGDVVEPALVDRMTITLERKGSQPVRWCVTPITATGGEPPRLEKPILPKGALIDELGQSTLRDWRGKSRSVDEVVQRMRNQLKDAPRQRLPQAFSKWGGWKKLKFNSTGFFHTMQDGTRWWLVDPDGHPFWSAGCDCVRIDCEGMYSGLETALTWLPDTEGEYKGVYSQRGEHAKFVNYLKANLIRAFGSGGYYEKWSAIALASLRRFGFNTVANWSDWQIARAAGFPYVRPLSPDFTDTPKVFREFPDVYHPTFAAEAETYARQLEETRGDSALIGYFLMNEPSWGFASLLPAEGMLMITPACETRTAFAKWLQEKYGDRAAFAKVWAMPEISFETVESGVWGKLPEAARPDLEAFSSMMVEKLFRTLTDACRRVDPDHLNLGARYYTVPPRWAFEGMKCFDVFSVNGYGEKVKPELGAYSREIDQPVMIGEWHFGALDVGLSASGIGHVKDQAEHDEAPLGRSDGENWNIGFLDICHREYEPLSRAARESHECLYEVVAAERPPYDDAPEYLPMLFC